MPYVCTLGRGPGRWTVLRPTRKRRLCVQPATTPRSLSLSLSFSFFLFLYLSPVCDYLSKNSWMKGDLCRAATTIVARCATPVPNAVWHIVSEIIFRETSFDRRSIRRDALASLLISGSNAISKTISRATQRCDRNKFLRSSIVHDCIAWQFAQQAF